MPIEAQALDDQWFERPHQVVGEEERAERFGHQPLEPPVGEHLVAVRPGDAFDALGLQQAIELAAGSTVAVDDDHPSVAFPGLSDPRLHSRRDSVGVVVQQRRHRQDIGAPAVFLAQGQDLTRQRTARDQCGPGLAVRCRCGQDASLPFRAAAMASRCRGVLPQHAPMIRAPASATAVA